MSFDVSWDIEKYREDHESDEHWQLRRNFIERWKESYPEERLVCLARVFANMEFMGCRYPQEVMQEVARMSKEVNSEVTFNKNFANASSFHEPSLAQNTGFESPYAIESTEQLDSTNYSKVHDSSENVWRLNEYVRSPYSKEVMQGPVSVCKVLGTEQSKSFIHENSLNMDSARNKLPRMDSASQSSLSKFTDRHLDTFASYQEPRNSMTTCQYASQSVLSAGKEPNTTKNHNIHDKPMILQESGVGASSWQTSQKPSQAYNIPMPCPAPNDGNFNYIDLTQNQSSQEHTNNYNDDSNQQEEFRTSLDDYRLDNQEQDDWNQPVDGNGLDNQEQDDWNQPVDDNYLNNQEQNDWNEPGDGNGLDNQEQNDWNEPVDGHCLDNQKQNDWNEPGDGNCLDNQEQNDWNQPDQFNTSKIDGSVNIHAGPRNIYVCTSDIGPSTNAAASNINVNASNVGAGVNNNTNPTCNVTTAMYNTVIQPVKQPVSKIAGKKPQKLVKLCQSGKKKYRYWLNAGKSPIEARALAKIRLSRVPEYKEIKKTMGSVRNFCRTTAYEEGRPRRRPRTSHIRKSKTVYENGYFGNIKLDNTNKNSNNDLQNNVVSTTPIMNKTATTSKITAGKNSKTLPVSNNNQGVKQLKVRTKATLLRLAQAEKLKQQITNTEDTNQQCLKIERNDSVIEISDDEDAKQNAAKLKARFEKDMQEKRRIWWLQQGKTEEEATVLCQKPMTISVAVENITENKEILNKELQENSLPIRVKKRQSDVHESYNTSDNISEINARENIEEDDSILQLNNAIGIVNAFYSENMETNKCIPGIPNPIQETKFKIPNAANTVSLKNTGYTESFASPNTNIGSTLNTPHIANNVTTYKIYIKDAKKEILMEEILLLQNAIAQCISDNDQVKFLRVNRLSGCAVVTCSEEYSRDWLDKQIPTLIPWEGAELIILNEADIPSYLYAWIYVPVVPEVNSVINPEDFINKLHEQNKKVGCDKWVVLSTQFHGEGQLFFVRFDSKTVKLLHNMGYKLNWFSARPIKVKVKHKNKDTINKLIKKKVKTPLNKKNVVNPFNQNKLTKISLKNVKITNNSTLTNTEDILRNQKVENFAPVITTSDDYGFGRNPQEENNYDETETNLPLVFGPDLGNGGNLNAIGMPSSSVPMCHYPIQGIQPQPSTSHASEMSQQNYLETSTSIEYSNQALVTDQAKVLLDARPLAENRLVHKSQTDQANRSDLGRDNVNEHRFSTVEHLSSVGSRVKATSNSWGIDTPRLLPGHRSALKLRTDLWDYDDLRERINDIKRANIDQRNYNNMDRPDFNFQDIFTGRDEEYSLEERVFASRKTSRENQGQGILREDRILRRDRENSLSNRDYDESGRVFYRDEESEQGMGYLRNNEESSHRHSQEDFTGEAQPYPNVEITSSHDRNSRPESSRVDRQDNSQKDYAIDEREDEMHSWKLTDLDKNGRYPEDRTDWDENSQGYSWNEEDLEDWGPVNSRDDIQRQSQDKSSRKKQRRRANRSAGRGDREYCPPKGSNRADTYSKNRDQRDRSRSAHSREFFYEDRVGSRRETDSRREPDNSRQNHDSRFDGNVGVPRILVPKKKRSGAYKRALQKKRNNV